MVSGRVHPVQELVSKTSFSEEEKADTLSSPQPTTPRHLRFSSLFAEWWMEEILAGVLSLLCLVSIVIILVWYDARAQPSLRLGITLNAVVALLATIMKASSSIPLAQCISQLKWISFAGARPHPITDFDVYDSASRGGWGNLELLWRLRASFWK